MQPPESKTVQFIPYCLIVSIYRNSLTMIVQFDCSVYIFKELLFLLLFSYLLLVELWVHFRLVLDVGILCGFCFFDLIFLLQYAGQ